MPTDLTSGRTFRPARLALGLAALTLALGACGGSTPETNAALKSQAVTCAAWNTGTAYTAGDTVTVGGATYRANWWTQGDNPATNSGPAGSGKPWTPVSGVCGAPTPPPPPPSTGVACFYADVNFGGASFCADADSGWVGTDWNDRISSLKVQGGYQVQLFNDINYGGVSKTFSGDVATVGSDFNDLASSFKVLKSVTPPPPPSTGLKYWTAPYVLPGESTPDIGRVMDATGQKTFMLAFILAPNGGGCTPTWDGTRTLDGDTVMGPIITTVRGKGGDVSVSAGGYGGTKLGQSCPDAAATAAAYQKVIDKYQLKAMDFDLEEPEYENLNAIGNEVGAIAILQRNNPRLYVSVTLPGTSSGTGYFGKNVLTTAKSLGVTNANFSIMPFDGGFNGASSQIAALELFHQMLMDVFAWDAATAYRREGVSMMNGRTDVAEHFYPADFQQVLDYAHTKGLGRYTFWSVGRDRACPGNADLLSASCSGVAQGDWEFTKFTARF